MELTHLRTFVAVAEEAHLTRAAERLFTSQPAVSAQLKALEETLGVSLFNRLPKGMKLTPAGERLLVQARAALDAAGAVMEQARALRGETLGRLSIGINSDFDFLKLGDMTQAFNQQYSGIELSLLNGMSYDIIQQIRRGTLDAGFFFGPCENTGDLQLRSLCTTTMALVGPVAWRDRFQHATREELVQLPWIYTTPRCPFFQLQRELFNEMNYELQKTAFVDSEDAIRALVQRGAGIAFLREDDADRAEAAGWGVRWQGVTPSIELSIAWRKNRDQEPLITALQNVLTQLWPELSDGRRTGDLAL
ncbi:MAG: LysR family transcriptional regulator [unclassified Hahellaceae]|nr:LysR family transcriptional regulator [Hahellaceae bacterium]|tara:strand:+ start:70004 stop:70921 length:918 start_codon:yes stop_codon:yes gene_type:complete